jgi:hypothetical protein
MHFALFQQKRKSTFAPGELLLQQDSVDRRQVPRHGIVSRISVADFPKPQNFWARFAEFALSRCFLRKEELYANVRREHFAMVRNSTLQNPRFPRVAKPAVDLIVETPKKAKCANVFSIFSPKRVNA